MRGDSADGVSCNPIGNAIRQASASAKCEAITRPASAMSVRSLRYALNFASGRLDRPDGGGADLPLPEVALEPFKEFCPVAGADDEYVSAVVLVSLAAQIAERA